MEWCLDIGTTFTFSGICTRVFQFSRLNIVLKPDQVTAENSLCSISLLTSANVNGLISCFKGFLVQMFQIAEPLKQGTLANLCKKN
jgi:hypothetical protein